MVVVEGGLCLVTQQLTEGLFALRPSGEVLFVLFEMAAHEELPWNSAETKETKCSN